MLINFHGFGGCASQFSANVGDLHTVANSNNFLVAYPQGITRTKGGAEWDPGNNGSKDISTNDAYFVEQLINNISCEYNVDASRIYAAGYSNGGMMAYGLACTSPNLIAASGIMSGIMLEDECEANEYTSIIHFHGTDDGVLPYNGNQDYQPVEDVVNFWLNHNNYTFEISICIFIVAWIGQFIGHKIEGAKPSFLDDIKFLLIGPAWLISFIYNKIGIKY